MAKARLTELGVAKLAPPSSGRTEIFDSTLPGFGVRVTSSGIRSFFVMTRCAARSSGSRWASTRH